MREILVKDGETVQEGQVLIRMDARLSEADRSIVEHDLKLRELQLRRIEAELAGLPMKRQADDPPALFVQVEAQHKARLQAYQDALDGEVALLAKAQQELKVALEIEGKLKKTVPIYRDQAEGWNKLAREGFAGKLMAMERQRLYIQKYGMVDGVVQQISADAQEKSEGPDGVPKAYREAAYRALIDLDRDYLESQGRQLKLVPGMLVNAEIHLGTRSVLEYLLSPVRKVVHEAGRER